MTAAPSANDATDEGSRHRRGEPAPVIARSRDGRDRGERFGDLCHRARIGEVLLGVAG
jgi:hypothetical protein